MAITAYVVSVSVLSLGCARVLLRRPRPAPEAARPGSPGSIAAEDDAYAWTWSGRGPAR